MDRIVTIPFAFPGAPGVRCVFTTCMGGASRAPYAAGNLSFDVGDEQTAVVANRQALQAQEGFAGWAENRQVHGDVIRFDPPSEAMLAPATHEADGLASSRPGLALAAKTADCQPVLLAHASGRAVAALHVGWRGNRIGFPVTGVRAFCSHYGFDPASVLAVRGPSLGPAASEFVNFEKEFGPEFSSYFDSANRTVDLWRLTRDQLQAAGLQEKNIFSLDLCTFSLPGAFYSYRRERTTGRQAGVIWIEAK
ncbi:MAG: purine-nucleoside/S-methyl-5-thioadenosine phosphorylase / adenosine deaminase [Desulfovibrionales bacterium]|jgi:YfiH family protein|nr:purine-nucleoside/S-methyl-5-thioadenosine phosphorylase / adenosine deaminase [Desulfovibrionales bacterium]